MINSTVNLPFEKRYNVGIDSLKLKHIVPKELNLNLFKDYIERERVFYPEHEIKRKEDALSRLKKVKFVGNLIDDKKRKRKALQPLTKVFKPNRYLLRDTINVQYSKTNASSLDNQLSSNVISEKVPKGILSNHKNSLEIHRNSLTKHRNSVSTSSNLNSHSSKNLKCRFSQEIERPHRPSSMPKPCDMMPKPPNGNNKPPKTPPRRNSSSSNNSASRKKPKPIQKKRKPNSPSKRESQAQTNDTITTTQTQTMCVKAPVGTQVMRNTAKLTGVQTDCKMVQNRATGVKSDYNIEPTLVNYMGKSILNVKYGDLCCCSGYAFNNNETYCICDHNKTPSATHIVKDDNDDETEMDDDSDDDPDDDSDDD